MLFSIHQFGLPLDHGAQSLPGVRCFQIEIPGANDDLIDAVFSLKRVAFEDLLLIAPGNQRVDEIVTATIGEIGVGKAAFAPGPVVILQWHIDRNGAPCVFPRRDGVGLKDCGLHEMQFFAAKPLLGLLRIGNRHHVNIGAIQTLARQSHQLGTVGCEIEGHLGLVVEHNVGGFVTIQKGVDLFHRGQPGQAALIIAEFVRDTNPQFKAIAGHFCQGIGCCFDGAFVAGIDIGDRRADLDGSGGVDQGGADDKRIAPEHLRNPKIIKTALFRLLTKLDQLRCGKKVSRDHQAVTVGTHGCASGFVAASSYAPSAALGKTKPDWAPPLPGCRCVKSHWIEAIPHIGHDVGQYLGVMMGYFMGMVRYLFLPLVLMLVGAAISAGLLIHQAKQLSGDGNWFDTDRGLDTSSYVMLGGVHQFVRVRSRDRNNPVLLDLHGGPGSPQTPMSHRSLRPLTEYFTLVEWDQRGAGRSTGDASLVDTMSYDRLVDDTIELIEHLQKNLDTQKVILVGHSWGSMLGLGVIQKRPDLIYAYVGVGQALAWPGGFDESQRLVVAAAEKAGDTETIETLSALPEAWPPQEDVDGLLERIGIIQAPLVTYGTALHASKSNSFFESNIALDVVTSPDIGVLDALAMLDVTDASKALMADLYGRDMRTDLALAFQVPMFIFQGAFDWQTPTTLVKPWFSSISAPHKEYVSFDHSAHIIINEEPGKFLIELVDRVRPFAIEMRSPESSQDMAE